MNFPKLSRPWFRVVTRHYNSGNSSGNAGQTAAVAGGGDKWHGSYHWTYERALSVLTLGLVGGAFTLYPNKMVDFGLGIVLPLHVHIGFSSIITDYLPRHKFPLIYPVSMGALYGLTGLTLYGIYVFNTEGPGICEGIATLWTAKRHRQSTDDE